ncbi:glycosyltransferase family 31 protein, partial [Atractiella rhizophila]
MSFLLFSTDQRSTTLPKLWLDQSGSNSFFESHPSWKQEDVVYGLNSTLLPHRAAAAATESLSVILLVVSSWLSRSVESRNKFRNSSLKLRPSSSSIRLTHRFVIGLPPTPYAEASLGKTIEAEAAKYGDMLLIPSGDRYDQLSEKVYASFGWANGLEEGFDYLIKTDDDVFLRLDTVLDELEGLGRRRRYWKGLAYHEMPPIRDASNKNAIFDYELGLFPPYTAGAMYILSRLVFILSLHTHDNLSNLRAVTLSLSYLSHLLFHAALSRTKTSRWASCFIRTALRRSTIIGYNKPRFV